MSPFPRRPIPRRAGLGSGYSQTDTWSNFVSLGMSDDKVVIASNDWDLDASQVACQTDTYEGATIRVIDWADLLDAGSLTVRDVSPTPQTSYFNWLAAQNTPTAVASTAGTTIHLVGDQYVDGAWGHVSYASVTGGARAGTAQLVGLTDLTATAALA